MTSHPNRPGLSVEQAQQLLLPIGNVVVANIERTATINDVFRVKTCDHGNFYVKFHTARWYADQPDTFFVVNRECAVHDLLRKRDMPLPYEGWADYTRCVVPRSVFICGELSGFPVTEALARHPNEATPILEALGRYLRRLHTIEFTVPGLLEPAHAHFAPALGPIPPIVAWPFGIDHAARCQQNALQAVAEAEQTGILDTRIASAFTRLLRGMARALEPHYTPPHFVVGNCHAYHFHVERSTGGWQVLGFYDMEAAAAGDITVDQVELGMTLTPSMCSYAWREPLFKGYGGWPDFAAYKMRMLVEYLLYYRKRAPSREIPDPAWLDARWMDLIQARDWHELIWYPNAKQDERDP
jgi:hypothetical protein